MYVMARRSLRAPLVIAAVLGSFSLAPQAQSQSTVLTAVVEADRIGFAPGVANGERVGSTVPVTSTTVQLGDAVVTTVIPR